jgi:hypothetical protein
MKSKSKEINLNQTKLIVENFEINNEDQTIICEGYDAKNLEDNEFDIEVSFKDFENWLDKNEYLKGEGEDCTGVDHEGEAVFSSSKWEFTFDEILNDTTDWSTTELITDFVNETKLFKELSK